MKIYIQALSLMLIFCSCNRDNIIEQEPKPGNKGVGRLELLGGIETSFKVDKTDPEFQATRNALEIYQEDRDGNGIVEENDPFTFEINIEKYKDVQMHLFLRRKEGNSVTALFAPVKIVKHPSGSNGKYSMSISLTGITPHLGENFTVGEWYIAGFWGGGEQEDKNTLTHKVKPIAPVIPNFLGEKVEMNIPLGFPWTRITGKWVGSEFIMTHKNLKIQPMGVLLSLILENRTQYPADIVALDEEISNFGYGGHFDLTDVNDTNMREGYFPPFKPSIIENINNKFMHILPQTMNIESAEKAKKPIYLWLMPAGSNNGGNYSSISNEQEQFVSIAFISKERTTIDQNLPIEDRFSSNGIGKFTDRYMIDLFFKKEPKNSQYFIKHAQIRSGLMITEYFINRYRIILGQTDFIREPNFCGFIELYNPNIDPIELKHYALARISNLRRILPDGTPGRNYAFMHPFAMDRYNEWERNGFYGSPQGRADRNADKLTYSHKALLISLKLKNNEISSFQPNSLGFSSHLETGNGIQTKLESDPSNDNRIERVRFLKGEPVGDAKLNGGKTILILGNAFIETGDPSNIPNYYYTDKYGNYGYYKPTYHISPQDWQKIMADQQCQIIVALDNYNQRGAYPIYKDAGVTNLNWSDALFLVQKHAKDPKRRRIIDATSANPFARVNNWTDFVSKVTLTNEYEAGKAHFRTRTAAQRMPEFLNFSHSQWNAAYFTGDLPQHASPGRRSAKK